MKLLVATSNVGKLKEFEKLFQLHLPQIEVQSLTDYPKVEQPIESGQSFRENAQLKAEYYYRQLGVPCIADDSGLSVEALGGAPGIFSARYAGESASDQDNIDKLLSHLDFSKAEHYAAFFRCALVAVINGEVYSAEGQLDGQIIAEERGSQGFGYNPIFWVPSVGKTLAEMTPIEKLSCDHRSKAFMRLVELIAPTL